jgi:hypothetical protein
MPARHASHFVPFAWAGFSLDIPAAWEPVALERDFVRFENEHGPRLECRWQTTHGGAYRLDKRLAKASSQMKRSATFDTDGDLPEPFVRTVAALRGKGYEARAFAWSDRSGQHAHPGALLHDPASDMAVILRAFPPDRPGDDEETARVVTTARCHPRSGERPWSVFGMRASLPGRLELKTFSFKPGHYRLQLQNGPKCRLDLERIGPAQQTLQGLELEVWAKTFFTSLNLGAASPVEGRGGWTVLERPWPRGVSGRLARAIPGFLRGTPFRLALRLADQESKILAVRMEGPAPLTDEEFDTVCDSYEVV